MFNILIAFILLVLIIVSEVKEFKIKEYKRKAAEKREREEEREIVRKIKAEHNRSKHDLDAEFSEKYNIKVNY